MRVIARLVSVADDVEDVESRVRSAGQRRSGHSKRTGHSHRQSPEAQARRWSAALRTRPALQMKFWTARAWQRKRDPPFSIKAISLFEEIVAQAPSVRSGMGRTVERRRLPGEVGAGFCASARNEGGGARGFQARPPSGRGECGHGVGRGLRPQLDRSRAILCRRPQHEPEPHEDSQRRGRVPAAPAQPTRRSD